MKPSKNDIKAAKRVIRLANSRAKEDSTNKAKLLQRILQDHEDIIDLIRTEMARAGFQSEQQDFYAQSCDIRFDVPESKQAKFWETLNSILQEHTDN